MRDELIRASKFLSLVLRHRPEAIGLRLDGEGWADVEELLRSARAHGHDLTSQTLIEVVETDDKRRFSFNEDESKIRANQGHSVRVDLGLQPKAPPTYLYHGTVARFLPGIRAKGLIRGARQHVHLSADEPTAKKVGARRGEPIVLRVRAGAMHEKGNVFLISANGVWLVEYVPAEFIDNQ